MWPERQAPLASAARRAPATRPARIMAAAQLPLVLQDDDSSEGDEAYEAPRAKRPRMGENPDQPSAAWLRRIRRFRDEGRAICPPCHVSFVLEEVLFPAAVEEMGEAAAAVLMEAALISAKGRRAPRGLLRVPCHREDAPSSELSARGFRAPPGMRGSPLANHGHENMAGRAREALLRHLDDEALKGCVRAAVSLLREAAGRGAKVALECYCWDMVAGSVRCSTCRCFVPLDQVGAHLCRAGRNLGALDFPLTLSGRKEIREEPERAAWSHSSRYGGYTISGMRKFSPTGSFMAGTPEFPDMVTIIKGALPRELEERLTAWIERDSAETRSPQDKYRKFTMPGALPTRYYQQVGNQQAERQTPQTNWPNWALVPAEWVALFHWVGLRFPLAQAPSFSPSEPNLIWDQSSYNLYYKTSAKTAAKVKTDGLAIHSDVECCRVGVTPAGRVYVYERVPQLLIAGGETGRWTIVLRDNPDPESGVLLSSFSNGQYRGIRAGDEGSREKVERKAREERRTTDGGVLVHFPAEMLRRAVRDADDTRAAGHATTLTFICGGDGNRHPPPKAVECPAAMVSTRLHAGAVTILNSSHVDADGTPVPYSSANTAAAHEVTVGPPCRRT